MSGDIDGPSGIGGWLLLPLLHLILALGMTAFNIFSIFTPDSIEGLKIIFAQGSELTTLRAPIVLSTIFGTIYLVYALYVLVKFLGKSSATRKLMIIFYCLGMAISLLEFGLSFPLQEALGDDSIAEGGKNLFRSMVGSAIWIPYFLVSVRVKNTFTPDTASEIGKIFD